jgi:hypothetical protein
MLQAVQVLGLHATLFLSHLTSWNCILLRKSLTDMYSSNLDVILKQFDVNHLRFVSNPNSSYTSWTLCTLISNQTIFFSQIPLNMLQSKYHGNLFSISMNWYLDINIIHHEGSCMMQMIDFGQSQRIRPRQLLHNIAGTPFYMAYVLSNRNSRFFSTKLI